MSTAIIKNFRGMRALILHPDDANRAKLLAVLENLGLAVEAKEPSSGTPLGANGIDLVLFDADEGMDNVFDGMAPPAVPLIAIIGHEAPGRLARVVRQRSASHILKPIRSSGVFTAVFVAMNAFEHRLRMQREIEALRQRLAGRRVVTKAVLHLMGLCHIDEDEAYEWLRAEAMKRRVPIEDMARESLGLDKQAHETLQQARISRNG
jgi:AmiR/NasT family two-component response regulator